MHTHTVSSALLGTGRPWGPSGGPSPLRRTSTKGLGRGPRETERAPCSQLMPRDAWAPPLVPGAAVAQRAIREPGTVSEQGTEAHQWPHQLTWPASGLRPVSLRPHGPFPALPPEDRARNQAIPRVATWSLGCAGPSRHPTSFGMLPLPAEPLQAPEALGSGTTSFPPSGHRCGGLSPHSLMGPGTQGAAAGPQPGLQPS